MTVFGTDYPTPDGTCVRDYIHVLDLARAHVKALEYLEGGGATTACNLGTGKGASVKEIIETAEAVTGKKIPVEYGDRREGDPPELVADASFAKQTLGWEAEITDLRQIVESAWAWKSGELGGKYAS
jgi:UDP-glucose 4-epimerase